MKLRGFSLLELMVVVVVIGILSSVAIPTYRNYMIQAKVGRALSLGDSLKVEVTQYFQDTGVLPTNGGGAGDGGGTIGQSGYTGPSAVANPTGDVSYMKWYGVNNTLGNIEIWFNSSFASTYFNMSQTPILVIQASVDANNNLTWQCVNYPHATSGQLPTRYLPSSCLGTGTSY